MLSASKYWSFVHRGPEEMKILMLHGYAQSGLFFERKTRPLHRRLLEAFPTVELLFPTAPVKLNPTDIPGAQLVSEAAASNIDAYSWFNMWYDGAISEYPGISASLDYLAGILEAQGPFDGVIAFSQGCVLATMVASLLEGRERRLAFDKAMSKLPSSFPYPESFKNLKHPPFRFGVSYGGIITREERYDGFYMNPCIQTAFCHFVGLWDPMVERSMTDALVQATQSPSGPYVVTHVGAHSMAFGTQELEILVAFIGTAGKTDLTFNYEQRVESF